MISSTLMPFEQSRSDSNTGQLASYIAPLMPGMNSDSQPMMQIPHDGTTASLQGQTLDVGSGMSSGDFCALLQQHHQQQQQQQHQQQQHQQQHQQTQLPIPQPSQLEPSNNSLSISSEIKRWQQLQQMGGNPSNALLVNPSSGHNDASTTAAFFQMFDSQQRGNANRFENPLASSMAMSAAPFPPIETSQSNSGVGTNSSMSSFNPMHLPTNFFTDPRMMMSQNHPMQLPSSMTFPGLAQQQQQQQQQQQPSLSSVAIGVGAAAASGNVGLPLPSPHALFHRDGSRRMRGGVIEPFPEKLHRLLLEVEHAGRADVISFVLGGQAFVIHKPDKFFKEIVPLYFRQSRLSSFKRQLNLYGFELINTGPARGGYYHELFLKDSPDSCRRMRRVAVKVDKKKDSLSTEQERELLTKFDVPDDGANPFSHGLHDDPPNPGLDMV